MTINNQIQKLDLEFGALSSRVILNRALSTRTLKQH